MSTDTPTYCNYFWGSHGCDLPANHEPATLHRCGSADPEGECCEYDETADADHRVRHMFDEWGEWGPYGEGWFGETWWRR